MPDSRSQFSVGIHRPVYYWGGIGTVRMNQLKFMGAENDIEVHEEALTEIGIRRISNETGFNWVYLMYDWGFPPEIAKKDWNDFNLAVPKFQDKGVRVFGYVQSSNCVYDGSYRSKDWYVQNPKGGFVHYYTGRYMACWLHPGWQERLKRIICGIIDSGADGVFFDNTWLGAMPLHFGGAWAGPGGCYCPRCRRAYLDATNLPIPTQIDPANHDASRIYLKWRANIVTETMASLAVYARSLNPNIFISINNYDPIIHPTFIMHGIDIPNLAKIQDVMMFENFSLPKWHQGTLVSNALTIKSTLALVGDTPVTTDPYDKGIGFDVVFKERRFQQAIGEAAACGTALVVKGTEYIEEDGTFTLLTAKKYHPQRDAIKRINTWLSNHSHLYLHRRNEAIIGLIFPEEQFFTHWDQTAAQYFGICQTLTYAGLPWKVVNSNQDMDGIETLFCFHHSCPSKSKIKTICVNDLPGWEYPDPSFLAVHPKVRTLVASVLGWSYRAYFNYPLARRAIDRLAIPQWFLNSPHFRIPTDEKRFSVIDAIGDPIPPIVEWKEAPVLIEIWSRGDERQVHLLNYGPSPQTVTVKLGTQFSGKILFVNHPETDFHGEEFQFELDVYSVLLY